MVLVPNGVDLDLYQPASAEKKSDLRHRLGWSGVVFLFTGRFSPDKVSLPILERFLTGWSHVAARRTDISFYLVGQGPLEEEYQQLIQKLGLEKSVHVWPARNNVSELYQAADIFVLPSQIEGLSNSLLEAMASGLPALASRVPGIVDIVEENVHGFLFDPLSVADMERGLHQSLQADAALKKIGENSRVVAITYSMNKTAEKYLMLYREN